MSKEKETRTPIPSWVGNHPPGRGEKRPILVRRERALSFTYGIGSNRVLCITYISTKNVQLGEMIIPPGGYFEPPDVHSGDEVYYVIEGEVVVFNPKSGRAFQAREGEVILIPKLVWHKSCNFGEEELRVLAIIAPLQWKKGEAEIPSSFLGKEKYYTGRRKDSSLLGKWPLPERQKELEVLVVKEPLNLIHGEEQHILVSFFVSDDLVHTGEISIPVGICSHSEIHQGDEVIYVTRGHLGVQIYEEETEQTICSVHEVMKGETFLVPEKTSHSYLNFSRKVTKFFFGIAPDL